MEEQSVQPPQDPVHRRVKFPRTRRQRFVEEGRLYDLNLSGPPAGDGQPNAMGLGPGGRTYDAMPMAPYPMPHMAPYPMQPPPQHNVTWADQASSSSEEGSTDSSGSDESDNRPPAGDEQRPLSPQSNNNDNKGKVGALMGTAMPSGRGPQESDTPPNGDPTARPWLQIEKTDDNDGPPVLGPPGRTPPPVRKNFKFPEELDDDDDVFVDETVPEVVFTDEMHHPAYGNYIPGQYQHTLNYLYGLETIREVDESMLYNETFKEKASSWDIFVVTLTLLGYLVNVGADIWLAYEYFRLKHYTWFAMTLLFIILPSLAMTIFSLVLYIQDGKVLNDKVSKVRWFIRAIFLVLLIAPVMRIIDTLHYGVKSRRSDDWRMRRRNLDRMRDEDTDSSLVRLFETFLENAPQLVLQLYVVVSLGNREGSLLVAVQILGLIMSLTTMAWSLVSFQSALRSSLPDKAEIGWWGKFAMFAWRLLTIAARVVALALFGSHFKAYVFAVIGGHFVIMFVWMTQQRTAYCMVQAKNEATGETKVHHSIFLEFCFRVMAAFVHIFCFFNLLEGHTRLRCLVYYTLVYIENTVLILCWNILASTLGHGGWYQMPAVATVMGGFFVGIMFQVVYYLWCHPNKTSIYHRHRRIRLWVPCAELSLFQELPTPTEQAANEVKPVFGGQKVGDGGQPGPARSEFGASAVSSMGPILAPMETSTPAPSTVGVSPPHPKVSPAGPPGQPASLETAPVPPSLTSAPDRPTLPIQATTPPPPPQQDDSPEDEPGPTFTRARPTTPSRDLDAPRSRPTTPARELEGQRSRPTTPARELEGHRSRPTTPARELEIRDQYMPNPTEPPSEKFETEV